MVHSKAGPMDGNGSRRSATRIFGCSLASPASRGSPRERRRSACHVGPPDLDQPEEGHQAHAADHVGRRRAHPERRSSPRIRHFPATTEVTGTRKFSVNSSLDASVA
ncbi:MAG: hypothetical protein ACRD2W_01525 [Acidimicrobiales bacterium]